MSKWALGLIAVVLFCIPIFTHRAAGQGLLLDTDTRVLLTTVRQRHAPLSWFAGDWPLGNHFYRPVSTLAFEADNALYGTDGAGYGLTNSLLCIGCVLLLFWFLRELTDRIEIAAPAAILFALWHYGYFGLLSNVAWWLALLSIGLVFLPGRDWKKILLASLTVVFLSYEFIGMVPLQPRMLGWLPGRTASVMTLFALLAMASYARFERTSANRLEAPEPGPLDPPNTKGTVLRTREPRAAWVWMVLAILGTAFALGSYEQAIMLPAMLFGSALCLRLQRYQVRWGWQVMFWGLLVGYFALRHALVPSSVSGYQAQQFRSGPGVYSSLLSYFLPGAVPVWGAIQAYEIPLLFESGGIAGLIMAFPIGAVLAGASNVAVMIASRKAWLFPLAAWAMSFIAFLPMAWLKHFDHYHYLPMAMRAFFVAAIAGVAGKVLVSAASRPALQAPPRLDPAPGSLPHP